MLISRLSVETKNKPSDALNNNNKAMEKHFLTDEKKTSKIYEEEEEDDSFASETKILKKKKIKKRVEKKEKENKKKENSDKRKKKKDVRGESEKKNESFELPNKNQKKDETFKDQPFIDEAKENLENLHDNLYEMLHLPNFSEEERTVQGSREKNIPFDIIQSPLREYSPEFNIYDSKNVKNFCSSFFEFKF